jgi:hypothetical protein
MNRRHGGAERRCLDRRDEDDRRRRAVGREPAGDRQAVHVRQVHVEQHGAGPQLRHGGERPGAVRGRPGDRVPARLQ